VVDLIGQVPSNIILVDHALTRTFDKGAIGIVSVVGAENAEIFEAFGEPAAEDTEAPVIPEGEVVDILAGSWEFQDQPADDEFAENESVPDYSVNVLTVKVGTTVTWVNQDDQQHTITAVDGSFDSGFMTEGQIFSHTFDTAGEFEYFCTPHMWMRAKVIVEP
jgi:nitrite reductase (NO-forming)